MKILARLLVIVAAATFPWAAIAQEAYPAKPIRLIVPFPPGAGTDTVARFVAQKIGESMKASIIIENKTGAGGAIGSILDAFINQVPGRLATLEAAAEGGNADAMNRAAHALRGAAATIGAHQLAALLEHVETAAQGGNVGKARGGLERVLVEAAAVLDHVRRDRDAHAAPAAGRP